VAEPLDAAPAGGKGCGTRLGRARPGDDGAQSDQETLMTGQVITSQHESALEAGALQPGTAFPIRHDHSAERDRGRRSW